MNFSDALKTYMKVHGMDMSTADDFVDGLELMRRKQEVDLWRFGFQVVDFFQVMEKEEERKAKARRKAEDDAEEEADAKAQAEWEAKHKTAAAEVFALLDAALGDLAPNPFKEQTA
jgi:hypothetical protein